MNIIYKTNITLIVFLLSCNTFAEQKIDNPSRPASTNKQKPVTKSDPYSKTMGSFIYKPELTINTLYDDNVFAQRSMQVTDTLLMIQPSFDFRSNWKKHLLKINLGAEIGRYRDLNSENFEDAWFDIQGRYDISKQTIVFGGFNFSEDHEERGTPDVVGTTPTTFDSKQLHAGFAHTVNKFKFRIGGTYEQLNFDDDSVINNDDRDRTAAGFGFRSSYLYKPNNELFFQLIADQRDYDVTPDDNGFIRDSDGFRYSVGYKSKLSNRLSMEAYIGKLVQNFDDPLFSKVNTFDINGNIKWLSSPASSVKLKLEQTLEETTLAGASSYLYQSAGLVGSRKLSPKTRVVASIAGGRAKYQDASLVENLINASLGIHHKLTPEVNLSASYRISTNDSNQITSVNNAANPQFLQDYVRQQVMLSLNVVLFDVNDPDFGIGKTQEHLKLTPSQWRGFYLGLQSGFGSSFVNTNGTRGNSGTDYGEYGNDGTNYGVFAGFGIQKNRWYLGIEAETEKKYIDITHSKNKPNSRTLAISNADQYTLGLRGGYKLINGNLIYTRLGRTRSKFDTQYQINNEPLNAVSQGFDSDGTRYGIGTDIVAGDNLFLRLDYSYIDFGAYDVDLVTAGDVFSPNESYFRLGLGWQFTDHPAAARKLKPTNIDGIYSGIQIGHTSLLSDTNGIHNDSGSNPGTYSFQGEFGHDRGLAAGIFAGVGKEWNRFYLGVEIDSQANNADWQHVRFPTGRDFSVEQKSTLGLGLRVGYKLNNGTLMYISASRTRSRFITNWIKGGNRSNDINRDDKVYGNRLALGADMPLSRSSFLRMSYSSAEYDPYRFISEHANSDDMTFDNTSSSFNLGMGVHF